MARACQSCAIDKSPPADNRGPLSSTLPSLLLEKIYIDYIGPLPRSAQGNAYALVPIDAFLKFSWIRAVRIFTTLTTIRILSGRIFSSFGLPQVLDFGYWKTVHLASIF